MLAAVLLATAADFGTLRFTETSVTEAGRLDHLNYNMKTKGYGIGLILPSGFGAHFTSLSSVGRGTQGDPREPDSVDLRHIYADGSYTHAFFDDTVMLTGGAGLGVAGKARYRDGGGSRQSTDFAAKAIFLGPGVAYGRCEVYWIHRRNFVEFKKAAGDGRELTMSSQHYQLGLAVRL